MTKAKATRLTHIRIVSHISGPGRQIKAGRVLVVGNNISQAEAARLLDKGLAEDAGAELIGQDLGLLVQQLKTLPESQLASLLGQVGDTEAKAEG